MADSVDVLIRKAEEALKTVREHYEADLSAKRVSDDTLYAVGQIVIDCQRALDYPIGKTPEDFETKLEEQIKGLAVSHPKIAKAFGRHQPYRAKRAELAYLKPLRKVNSHEDFTPQQRVERQVGLRQEYAGAIVEHDFIGGNLRAGPPRGSTNTIIDGSPPLRVQRIVYVDWQFVDPPVSVLPTLQAIVRLTRAAVKDIRREANL